MIDCSSNWAEFEIAVFLQKGETEAWFYTLILALTGEGFS